jgi:hypothetical protein
VAVCHSLSISYLKNKLASGKLNVNLMGLNCLDIGYDCIAELFQQDESGNFKQLKTYFEGFAFDYVSDEELLIHLRSLVISRTNQGIYRLYSEIDPSLGKILRNLKLSLRSLGNFVALERFGETYIVPKLSEPLEDLPICDIERLERELSPFVKGTERIPDLLSKLSLHLRNQSEYSRQIPLVSVGLMFRSLFSQKNETAIEDEIQNVDGVLLTDEATAIIRKVCGEIRTEMFPRYVWKKKVDEKVYENYFIVVERVLSETVVGDGGDYSLFESLAALLPGLTNEEYRRKHRNILEYLCRMARKKTIRSLKRRYGSTEEEKKRGTIATKLR